MPIMIGPDQMGAAGHLVLVWNCFLPTLACCRSYEPSLAQQRLSKVSLAPPPQSGGKIDAGPRYNNGAWHPFTPTTCLLTTHCRS